MNPGGHATYGVLIRSRDGRELLRESGYVGVGPLMSSNVAEYAGIIAIFRYLLKNRINQGKIRGDSKMVVFQLNGKMRVRSGLYYRYAKEAANLRKQLPDLVIQWIPREQNREADYLARQAMPKIAEKKRNAELARLIREQRADRKHTKKRTW